MGDVDDITGKLVIVSGSMTIVALLGVLVSGISSAIDARFNKVLSDINEVRSDINGLNLAIDVRFNRVRSDINGLRDSLYSDIRRIEESRRLDLHSVESLRRDLRQIEQTINLRLAELVAIQRRSTIGMASDPGLKIATADHKLPREIL